MTLFNKIFSTYSEKHVKRINKLITRINKLETSMIGLSADNIKEKTIELKEALKNGKSLDDILPEAFALCRETSKRVINIRHFDVQLIGGIILHQGRIAEMKTGEGKTFVATLPAYLNALSGNGVHIVTVNDYLANRDFELNKPVFEALGLTCGVVLNKSTSEERIQAYNCDVTYITNTELGFDYLRDNMVLNIKDRVQRKLSFAIIDEVDSILIDEARTPLIISCEGSDATELYSIVDKFAKTLKDEDIEIDEKVHTVILTESGVLKAEKIFNLENYADIEHSNLRHHINQALKANFYMKKDKNYLVKDGKIIIIDEFTGRIAEGRRYSQGLHQAIEVKENLEVNSENETLATITYQNFFRIYNKISGMTGTAITEENEFRETYGLDVIEIPTNKQIIRKDKVDNIYVTKEAKLNAIIKDVERNYKKGRPVLIGTTSILESEFLSEKLSERGIPHNVLNAKYHEIEADIISKAGEFKSVTVATNMAGRGTDIKLSEDAIKLGGLKIIGTSRNENRRIDNQLRGRAGRQGDPGVSQFYVSFEDEIMTYAPEQIKGFIAQMNKSDDKPIKNKFLTSAIEKAQKSIESAHFNARKEVLKYDEIVNKQRILIFSQRNMILKGIDYLDQLKSIINDVLNTYKNEILMENNIDNYSTENDVDAQVHKLLNKINNEIFSHNHIVCNITTISLEDLIEIALNHGVNLIESKMKELGDNYENIFKVIMLKAVDINWIKHIENMNELKRDVRYMGLKGQDPLGVYILESAKVFDELIFNLQSDIIKGILNINAVKPSTDNI